MIRLCHVFFLLQMFMTCNFFFTHGHLYLKGEKTLPPPQKKTKKLKKPKFENIYVCKFCDYNFARNFEKFKCLKISHDLQYCIHTHTHSHRYIYIYTPRDPTVANIFNIFLLPPTPIPPLSLTPSLYHSFP